MNDRPSMVYGLWSMVYQKYNPINEVDDEKTSLPFLCDQPYDTDHTPLPTWKWQLRFGKRISPRRRCTVAVRRRSNTRSGTRRS